jgi:hypothetical protein
MEHGYPTCWFAIELEDRLKCPLCLEVLNDPYQCSVGHNFCRFCITRALQNKEECPMCRRVLIQDEMTSNAFARGIIEELPAICHITGEEEMNDNVDGKCAWVGPLHQRDNHLSKCSIRHPFICPFYLNGCAPTCIIHYKSIVALRTHAVEYAEFRNTQLELLRTENTALKLLQVEGYAIVHNPMTVVNVNNQQQQSPATVFCGSVGVDNRKDGLGVTVEIGTLWSYCGRYTNNLRHGYGVCKFHDGSVYTGMWVRDHMHGRCVLFTNATDGNVYSGSYCENLMHGLGRLSNPTSSFVYKGQFVNGLKHGHGEMTMASGQKQYVGSFTQDKIAGEGVMTDLVSHESISGTFVDAVCTGKGILRGGIDKVLIYSGDFVNSLFEGVGVLFQSDGAVYAGDFVEGRKEGYGELTQAEQCYVGGFVNNLCHGEGVVTEHIDGIPCNVVYSFGDIVEGSKMVFDLSM